MQFSLLANEIDAEERREPHASYPFCPIKKEQYLWKLWAKEKNVTDTFLSDSAKKGLFLEFISR